jgi:predicted outer membrane repeat protein
MKKTRRIPMNLKIPLLVVTILTATNAAKADILLVPSEYGSIQSGINAAASGDTVSVESGIYYETINFLGKEITVSSASGIASNTVIDGNVSTGSVVSFISGETSNSVLEGMTVRNGSSGKGGGVLIENSSPLLRNCIVSGNNSTNNGGGVYVDNGEITLDTVIIKDNTASSSGAGLYLKFSNCSMVGGSLENNSSSNGGALYVKDSPSSGDFILDSVSFEDNSAENNGGGLYAKNSYLDVQDCDFSSNYANRGGAWFSYLGGDALIVSTSFSYNSAKDVGGAIDLRNSSSVTFTNCEFNSNIADSDCDGEGDGAILDIVNSEATLQNPTVCDNLVCDVEGDYSGDSSPTIVGDVLECVIGIGACCGGAACWEMSESDCLDGGGDWVGDATVCVSSSCDTSGGEPLGGCCLADACVMAPEHACMEADGDFAGEDVDCVDVNCESACAADINGDNLVDVLDIIELISAWGACP